MNPEDAAKSLITEAHASVVSQFFIENGKDRHIIYIHDIIIKPNGELDIKYSTPSEHVDKEWLYNEVQKAIKLILDDVIQQEKEKSFFKKVLNLFKGK
ncbi:head vertex assembly chaperone [Cronobacter phage S13]|jgi:hypothetical protein|uniref:Head vertex assembly chaperone n=1 Tax=Cronobacter phage LPCS28 TaxID=2924885 RepID=A0AAE9G7T2_9CAUD|nr:head vertex assembly chaperone [Cronobacter phage S13]YP_010665832.1 head vertex assembly chaperone [Cronobacter phage LPCS28]AIA65049.1 hypothetical protein S13_252 [Cronobacter phage S13]UNY47021.1 hypothetical protein EHEKIMEA_00139 [Cronobacter phage LPCS28]